MNWIRFRAYADTGFALEQLYSRLTADIHEANRLPEGIRLQRGFWITRPDRPPKAFLIHRSSPGQPDACMAFGRSYANPREIEVVVRPRWTRGIRAAVEESGEVKWWHSEMDAEALSIELWRFSEYLLQPFVFE